MKFLHQITFLVGEASLEEGEECFSPSFGTDLTFVKNDKEDGDVGPTLLGLDNTSVRWELTH